MLCFKRLKPYLPYALDTLGLKLSLRPFSKICQFSVLETFRKTKDCGLLADFEAALCPQK